MSELRQGRQWGAFSVVSVLASDGEALLRLGGPALTDLLAVNIEEAKALSELAHKDVPGFSVARQRDEFLSQVNAESAAPVLALNQFSVN